MKSLDHFPLLWVVLLASNPKNPLPAPDSEDFLPFFFLEVVFYLTLNWVAHCKLLFVELVVFGWQFISLTLVLGLSPGAPMTMCHR